MSEPEDTGEGKGPDAGRVSGGARTAGIVLMAVAVLMWVGAAVVFLLPLSGGQKAWAIPAFLVGGEAFFWISAALLGRELFRRYRSYLDPRRFFRKGDR